MMSPEQDEMRFLYFVHNNSPIILISFNVQRTKYNNLAT